MLYFWNKEYKFMCRKILIILLFFVVIPSFLSAEGMAQQELFNFSKMTPDKVVMLFGPPSIIKTEEIYTNWVINKAKGCGQTNIYVMSYSSAYGDLSVLMGPFGIASETEVVIDNGIVCEVVWIYDNDQLDPAFSKWMSNKKIKKLKMSGGTTLFSMWRPNKGTIMTAECFTGGGGEVCRGPISVHYGEDTEK
jgi:hypothetical protein